MITLYRFLFQRSLNSQMSLLFSSFIGLETRFFDFITLYDHFYQTDQKAKKNLFKSSADLRNF